MPIRLRKPDGSRPAPPLRPEAVMGDPPIYQETLLGLVALNPSFMLERRVAQPARDWSALDALVEEARERGVAA
jgi:hypothetical protein